MNTVFFSGYLSHDANDAYTPAGERRVQCVVMVKDSKGVEFPEKCVIEDAELIAKNRTVLTSGRGVIVEGEQTARLWVERGYTKGYVREVRVFKLEVPVRTIKAPDDEKNETEEKK